MAREIIGDSEQKAYISRTISVMPGEGPSMRSGALAANGDSRSSNSPLQIFVKAKKSINDIFGEVETYVKDTVQYIQELKKDNRIASEEEIKLIEGYTDKVKAIRDVLKRDHMKVTFFGRTSNGKSTVINAMLRDKILPSGIGHTTNCFLQVEGSDNGESYLMTEGSSEKQNVKSVAQLGNALSKEKLKESQLVHIFWPKEKCLLLRDDVVFVDSPGIDVSPNLDEWIDAHCLDADVFVLVANAESTLMVTEKNFFHKVSTKISKPNIFILNNRWDASASEPELLDGKWLIILESSMFHLFREKTTLMNAPYLSQLLFWHIESMRRLELSACVLKGLPVSPEDEIYEVRAQHTERTVEFLVKELKVCTQKEAQERIFFVSAKEALQARLCEQKGQPAHSGALAEGFPNRYFEFQDFERKFEECISKSAVKTKFEQHSQRGKLIITEIRSILDGIYETALRLKSEKSAVKKEYYDKLVFTEQQLLLITQEMKEKIHRMVEDVEQRVSKALSEEIRRLSVLVDEFALPFHPEPVVLNVYKREIHSHVENGLGSNLRARLSTALAINIENSQREMTERMAALLPEEKRQLPMTIMPRREPFEILYRLNCDNLCADFQEDLEFRFSWGITALISRFSGKSGNFLTLKNYKTKIPTSAMATPDNALDVHSGALTPVAKNDDWSVLSRIAFASVTSQGTMGGLLFAGLMMKTVGWKVILVCGAVYGCIYFYERLTWTNKAKERAFKKQYVNHATKKLRLIVDLTSANCSHQVQQELSSTFARLCHLVDEANTDMRHKIKELDKEIKELEEGGVKAKVLRNKANYVLHELEMFEDTFLKSNH